MLLVEVWVLLIKLPQGWRRSPPHRPVWPSRPAGTHGRLRALQHLAPKVLRQHVFFFILAFPSDSFFHIFSPSTSLSFLQPPLVTPAPLETLLCFQHFQCFVSFCFKLLGQLCHFGHRIKDTLLCSHSMWYNRVPTSVSNSVTVFLSTTFPCLFSPWAACSTV